MMGLWGTLNHFFKASVRESAPEVLVGATATRSVGAGSARSGQPRGPKPSDLWGDRRDS